MRVGFLTQLLFERYGAFWSALVASAGAVAVYPTRDGVMGHAADVDHDAVPSLSFRLAAVQAASLADCDLIIVPELNPEMDSARGSAQDRWVADLAGALADAVPGLPPLVSVAAYPDPGIESRAVSLLQQLVHETGAVTRVWARNRAAAERMTTTIAAPRRGPVARAGLPSAALVGQPWLVTEAVAAAATEAALTGLSMRSVPLDQARAEGLSFDERLIPSDAEVVGAARVLSRRAGVTALRYLVDEGAGSDAWLLRRVTQASHKPVEQLTVREVARDADLAGVFLNLSVD